MIAYTPDHMIQFADVIGYIMKKWLILFYCKLCYMTSSDFYWQHVYTGTPYTRIVNL